MVQEEKQTNVVIITALEKEANALLKHLKNVETYVTKRRTFYQANLSRNDKELNVVVLSLPMMGNVQAAIATTQAIDVWNPEYVIITGIAGGVKKSSSYELGDVIVAEQIVGYESGRITDGEMTNRFDVLRPAHELISAAKKLKSADWALSTLVERPDGKSGRVIPNVHFGVVASGEKVIADKSYIDNLKISWSQLAAVDMEGYGTALASYEADSAPGMLLVKSICDWADYEKDDKWQEYSADVAATYTTALLWEIPFRSIMKGLKKKLQAKKKKLEKYSHRSKIGLCRRMGHNWEDLADYFNIPLHERNQFKNGRECQGIWDWLVLRDKISGIKEALKGIKREDLMKELIPETT